MQEIFRSTEEQTMREGKNASWEKRCVEIESMIGGCQSTEVWKCLKTLKNNFHSGRLNILQ